MRNWKILEMMEAKAKASGKKICLSPLPQLQRDHSSVDHSSLQSTYSETEATRGLELVMYYFTGANHTETLLCWISFQTELT